MAAITQQGSSDQPARSRVAGPVGQFVGGVGLLGRGLGLYARTPRLVLLGLLPVAVTAMLFGAALVTLLFFLGDLAAAVTWFATDWSQGARQAARVLAAIALLGAAVLLGIVTFTMVTLTLGAPWYERISEQVEQWCGGAPPPADIGFWLPLLAYQDAHVSRPRCLGRLDEPSHAGRGDLSQCADRRRGRCRATVR